MVNRRRAGRGGSEDIFRAMTIMTGGGRVVEGEARLQVEVG